MSGYPPQQPPPGYPPQQPPGGYPPQQPPSGGYPSYPGPQGDRPDDRRAGFFKALFDFSFTHFATPKIVKFAYVLLTILLAVGHLIFVIAGFAGTSLRSAWSCSCSCSAGWGSSSTSR